MAIFLTLVKEKRSFKHGGLNTWEIHIVDVEKVYR